MKAGRKRARSNDKSAASVAPAPENLPLDEARHVPVPDASPLQNVPLPKHGNSLKERASEPSLIISEDDVRAVLPPRKKLRAETIAKQITKTLEISLRRQEHGKQQQMDKIMCGIVDGDAQLGANQRGYSLFEASNYDPSNPYFRGSPAPRANRNIKGSVMHQGGSLRGLNSGILHPSEKNSDDAASRLRVTSLGSHSFPYGNDLLHLKSNIQPVMANSSIHGDSRFKLSGQKYLRQPQQGYVETTNYSPANARDGNLGEQSWHEASSSDTWFFKPGAHCIKTQSILDLNSQMILRLATALAADRKRTTRGESHPMPEHIEATKAVVSRFATNIKTLVDAAGQAMTTRLECQQTGQVELTEMEHIVVALNYGLQTTGNDMRLRVVLLSCAEKLCLSKSISKQRRELYDVLICFLQRDIETEKPRREALRILSKIVDDLHRDNFSAQNYIHLVQRLPLRRRNLTEKMIIAKRDNVLLFDALEDYSKLYGENRLDGNGSRPYIKLSGPGKPKPKEESAEVKKMLQQRYRLKRFGGLDSSQRQQQQQQQSLPLQRSTEYNYTHQYQNISQIGYHQTQFQGQSNLVQQKMFQQNDLSQHQPQLQQPQPQHLQYPQHPQQPQHIQRARDFSSLEQRLPWFEASTSDMKVQIRMSLEQYEQLVRAIEDTKRKQEHRILMAQEQENSNSAGYVEGQKQQVATNLR